jgi:hypothetical protein
MPVRAPAADEQADVFIEGVPLMQIHSNQKLTEG